MTDADRVALRPSLDLAPASTPEERFQNETLRPIAKQQHVLLLMALRLYLRKRKVDMDQTAKAARFAKVKELVARDNRLRGLLFGMVAGQFTQAEMAYYVEHEGPMNRRITNLLTERLSGAFA